MTRADRDITPAVELPTYRYGPVALRSALSEVCGAGPPDWLTRAVCRPDVLGFVVGMRAGMDRQPRRTTRRSQFERVRRLAETLKAALDETYVATGLANARPHDAVFCLESSQAVFTDTAERAAIQAEFYRSTKGTNKDQILIWGEPDKMASPEILCAILICEIWRAVHGELPRPTAKHTRRTWEYLWEAAGGTHVGPRENRRAGRFLQRALLAGADGAQESLEKAYAKVARTILRMAKQRNGVVIGLIPFLALPCVCLA